MPISRRQYEGTVGTVRYNLGLMKAAKNYLQKALANVMEARYKMLGGGGGPTVGKIQFPPPGVDLDTPDQQIDKAIKRLEETISIWEKNLIELSKEVE